jgi:hypothetical protein
MSKTFRTWGADQEWLLPASIHDCAESDLGLREFMRRRGMRSGLRLGNANQRIIRSSYCIGTATSAVTISWGLPIRGGRRPLRLIVQLPSASICAPLRLRPVFSGARPPLAVASRPRPALAAAPRIHNLPAHGET